jgi:hypothetical protein
MNSLEDLRKSFRPNSIKTLFVGESAPQSGKFFYSQNTGLYRAMQQAFHANDHFLAEFQAGGFYLDDLSLVPVNGMEPGERRRQCAASVASFSLRLVEYQPQTIVILLRSIDQWVREAVRRAGIRSTIYNVTYPGRFQNLRTQFQNEMAVILPQLLQQAVKD